MGLTKLKKIREEKGMTLEELAQRIETSRGHISNIESCKRDCTVEIAKKIAQVFRCKVDDLL